MKPLRIPLAVLLALSWVAFPVFANPPILVAEFDFEAPGGGPDAQGWRPFAINTTETTHFHIEDFSGAGHTAVPLAGQRSMWCGANVEDQETCFWDNPPGYGSDWNENLVSQPFSVTGDVTIGFLMDGGLETGYDGVTVAFEDTAGTWVSLDFIDCGLFGPCQQTERSYTVPASAHDGSVRFRFHFRSDGVIDNAFTYGAPVHEAFVVDSLTVSDATGMVDYQDFESEAIGDMMTADGHWYAEPNTDAHNGGLLVEGATVLQETTPINEGWFWAFYADSDLDYGCAGHPEQPVVPETRSLVRSPRIDLTRDAAGDPVAGAVDSVRLSFDVYRDIDPDIQKQYYWRIRSYADDCLADNGWPYSYHAGTQKDWFRHVAVLVPPVGATEIVIDLGTDNFNFNGSSCRSHSPLFDNVRVERFGGGVSAVEELPVPAPLVMTNAPNPFNPVTTIRYELPESGLVSLKVYDVAGRLVRTLQDKVIMPAGPGEAVWRGVDDGGRGVASGTYVARLTVGDQSVITTMALVR